ncbi:hypothetical protein [Ligilactobacillus acidipiscis]|uniref:hypothetical protein n=1 Tax=Ligilactobacillus acidipiscis TaxID=89059 RepID=UPI00024924B8|nr:hypothetical protein [Ligilactobacillus acidipiscis]
MSKNEIEWLFIQDNTFLSRIVEDKIKKLNFKYDIKRVNADHKTIQVLHMLNINEIPSIGIVEDNTFIPIAEGNVSTIEINKKLKIFENMMRK